MQPFVCGTGRICRQLLQLFARDYDGHPQRNWAQNFCTQSEKLAKKFHGNWKIDWQSKCALYGQIHSRQLTINPLGQVVNEQQQRKDIINRIVYTLKLIEFCGIKCQRFNAWLTKAERKSKLINCTEFGSEISLRNKISLKKNLFELKRNLSTLIISYIKSSYHTSIKQKLNKVGLIKVRNCRTLHLRPTILICQMQQYILRSRLNTRWA